MTPSPIAIGTRLRSRTSLRMPSGISENAWSVPFRGVAQREVLLDDAGAEHVRDRRHRDPVLMVGEPDHELRVAARAASRSRRGSDPRPPPDTPRCTGAGTASRLRGDDLDRAVDVVDRGAAGRDDERLAERGDVTEQRRVPEVAGRDLVARGRRAPRGGRRSTRRTRSRRTRGRGPASSSRSST